MTCTEFDWCHAPAIAVLWPRMEMQKWGGKPIYCCAAHFKTNPTLEEAKSILRYWELELIDPSAAVLAEWRKQHIG